jgi:hypothetical protein
MDTLGIDVSDSENSKNEIYVSRFKYFNINVSKYDFEFFFFLKRYCEVFNKSQYNQDLTKQIEDVKQEHFSAPSNYTP